MGHTHAWKPARTKRYEDLPQGRRPGENGIPHSAYPEIVRRYESGEELLSAIGRDYNVSGHAIRQLVRRLSNHA